MNMQHCNGLKENLNDVLVLNDNFIIRAWIIQIYGHFNSEIKWCSKNYVGGSNLAY